MKIMGLTLLLIAAGCGSVTSNAVDPTPAAEMTWQECVSYCGCAAPRFTLPSGLGECVCTPPQPDAGLDIALCQCGGWEQQHDAGSEVPPDITALALFWSPTAECASFNQP